MKEEPSDRIPPVTTVPGVSPEAVRVFSSIAEGDWSKEWAHRAFGNLAAAKAPAALAGLTP